MTAAALDASALLAFLREEPGGERVSPLLADSVMSTVNLSEVIAHFISNGTPEISAREILSSLQVTWIDFDSEQANAIAAMLPAARAFGLSLGDRACIALARRLTVPAITADRVWATAAIALGVEVTLIR